MLPADTPRADHEFKPCVYEGTFEECEIRGCHEYGCGLPRSAHPRPEPAEREPENCKACGRPIDDYGCDSPEEVPPELRGEPAAGDPLGALPAHVRSTVEAMARALAGSEKRLLIYAHRNMEFTVSHLPETCGDCQAILPIRAALASWRGLTK